VDAVLVLAGAALELALDVAGVLAKPFDLDTLGGQLAETLGWPP